MRKTIRSKSSEGFVVPLAFETKFLIAVFNSPLKKILMVAWTVLYGIFMILAQIRLHIV